jgi:transposase InsO family protein
MSAAGLAGVSRRKFIRTTVKGSGRQAPDLAVALDAWPVVGWSMVTTLATRLVLDALNMALAMRRPKGVIHHSDQGSQYTSIEFDNRCREAGVRPSMAPTTTRCARASLPRWNASFSAASRITDLYLTVQERSVPIGRCSIPCDSG